LDGADGHSLFYRLRGAGPDTIVIVHGFQGNNQNYPAADLVAVIVEPTLLFYDQRGGGRSAPVPDTAAPGLSEHVRDLEAVRTAMGFSHLTLLAHSGGAFIATQYALQFPERVNRLILVAPGSPVRDPFAAQTVAAFEARLGSATWDRMNTLRASMPTAEDPVSVCHEITSVMLPGAWLVNPSTVETMKGDFCAAPDDILRTESIRLSAFQESLGMWDWRSDQQDRAEERELLAALHQEFVLNQGSLTETVRTLEVQTRSPRALIAMNPAEVAEIPQDSVFDRVIRPFRRTFTSELAVGSLNSLISSGKLALIRRPAIRSGLAQYQALAEDASEIAEALVTLTIDATVALSRCPQFAQVVPFPFEADFSRGVAISEATFLAVLLDRELMALISAKAYYWAAYTFSLQQLSAQLQRVEEMIEAELNGRVEPFAP